MKRIFATILIFLACFLQLAFTAHAQSLIPAVNLVLVGIVLVSCFFEGSESIWLALLAGMILDHFSLSEFGVNTAFLVIIALVTKLLFNLGKSNSRLSFAIITVGLGTIFYNLLMITNLLFNDDIISYLVLTRQVGLEILLNIVSFIIAYACISLVSAQSRSNATKLTFARKR